MKSFDVAVIGVGAMGSAACWHLASAGLKVLGIEQFSIPNSRGSSHGATRILRLGLHESARYVPMVTRALELWHETGTRVGESLFHQVGSLDVADPSSRIFSGSLNACIECGIDHEVLDASALRARFPAIRPDAEMMAVHQPGSGFVLPEAAISAHTNLAIAHGAEIHGMERLLDWKREGQIFRITTDHDVYLAEQIVFTAGAWLGNLLKLPVEAERTVLGWFAPVENAHHFAEQNLPVWIVDSEQCGHFYGFPIHGVPGFKLGRLREHSSPPVDPDLRRREPDQADEDDMRQFVARYFPGANGPVLSMTTCFFENTPDRAPIVDRLPGEEGCWVAGGFSGHGFKYSSAIGEVIKDLVTSGASRFDLRPFAADRFV